MPLFITLRRIVSIIISLGCLLWFLDLTCGLLVGIPVSLAVFRAHWTLSAGMIEKGEASVLTFLYYGSTAGFWPGLFAGILGAIIYHFWSIGKRGGSTANPS